MESKLPMPAGRDAVVKYDPTVLPDGLPVPKDDGLAAHVTGLPVAHVMLPATTGDAVDLAALRGTVVVFAYPRTGRPDEPPLVPDWDMIPGARGCTPQTCGFRDLHAEFAARGARVFGLSTQETAYQREMAERLHVPFPVLSDASLELTRAMLLPAMNVAGQTLLKRFAWIARDGRIERVFYPVFPPDQCAGMVLAAL